MNQESNIVTEMAEHLASTETKINKYGNVPVFYAPKKKWLKPSQSPGLSHFINQATSVEEVNKLLERGKTKFVDASAKTIRRWEELASKKIADLTSAEK